MFHNQGQFFIYFGLFVFEWFFVIALMLLRLIECWFILKIFDRIFHTRLVHSLLRLFKHLFIRFIIFAKFLQHSLLQLLVLFMDRLCFGYFFLVIIELLHKLEHILKMLNRLPCQILWPIPVQPLYLILCFTTFNPLCL